MIHHVYANRSNIGDWLSALGVQRLLGDAGVAEHLCDAPFVPATLEALAAAGLEDVVVVGGGGLLMDYFVPFWEGLLPIMDRVPVALWGVGTCDLKREGSRPPAALAEAVGRAARLCAVRDERSRRLLGGPPGAPVPCPSLAAVTRPATSGWGLLHVDNYTTAGADVYDAMDAHARAFACATGRPFRRTNNRIEPGRHDALDATLARYAASDLVLASALHGCVLAVAMGRRVLAVSGDWKIEAFMAAAGLGDWVLGQDATDALPDALARLSGQPDRAAFVAEARAANAAVADAVRSLLPGEATP